MSGTDRKPPPGSTLLSRRRIFCDRKQFLFYILLEPALAAMRKGQPEIARARLRE
jgi:hypothetical protein